VQRIFIWAVSDRSVPFGATTPQDFKSAEDLKQYAREYHEQALELIRQVGDERLGEVVGVPWLPDPPLTLTVAEALTQCAMHSHYHRGQNATRLRELGGEPPFTDLIIWYWKGRPAPAWHV
jgi:uncharacterized damage-inducible protein DinB